MALFYKSRYVNGFVVLVYESIISGFHIVKYTNTALFFERFKVQRLKFNQRKNQNIENYKI